MSLRRIAKSVHRLLVADVLLSLTVAAAEVWRTTRFVDKVASSGDTDVYPGHEVDLPRSEAVSEHES